MMERWSHEGSQIPEDPGAMTRAELLAYAEVFSGEIMRWKVWYMRDQGPERLAEAQAIQDLSVALAALLAGTQRSRAYLRAEFASVAAFLGYTLLDETPGADAHLPTPETHVQQEQQEDTAFLRTHRLRLPKDDEHRS